MTDRLFSFWAFFKYWLIQEDQYSLQGPFLSNLYSELLKFRIQRKSSDLEIEDWRQSLLSNQKTIPVVDLGAGSRKVNEPVREISQITRHSTSGRKFCQLYQYFASLTAAQTIVELGTCMGISTRYLASICEGKVFTFEGSPEIQKIAKQNSKNLPIEFILGDLAETLPKFLASNPTIDFVLIDANHTYQGTKLSFDSLIDHLSPTSIVAIGDIHWSAEMERAWEEIKSHPKVKVSLDFYEAGVLLFDSPLKNIEHRVLAI